MKFLLALLAGIVVPGICIAASPAVSTVRVRPRSGPPGYTLFARVEPVHVLVVRAAGTGTLRDLTARPGAHVRAGERLARLGGPVYRAAFDSSRARLRAAKKAVRLAQDRLKATRSRYPVLSNRLTLDQARQALMQAEASLVNARAHFTAVKAEGTIDAPVAGTVSDVLASDGGRVGAGDGIADIHPAGSLWLRGAVYGDMVRAVHMGMDGTFQPTGGGKFIPVRITHLIPSDLNDGIGVAFAPTAKTPQWFDGESGLVTLQRHNPTELTVPTSALVLDHGRWWVVAVSGHKFMPVKVKPDGSRGGWTWIAEGVKPGERVVSSGAYRIFHRYFSKRYSGD